MNSALSNFAKSKINCFFCQQSLFTKLGPFNFKNRHCVRGRSQRRANHVKYNTIGKVSRHRTKVWVAAYVGVWLGPQANECHCEMPANEAHNGAVKRCRGLDICQMQERQYRGVQSGAQRLCPARMAHTCARLQIPERGRILHIRSEFERGLSRSPQSRHKTQEHLWGDREWIGACGLDGRGRSPAGRRGLNARIAEASRY